MGNAKIQFRILRKVTKTRVYDFMWESHLNQAGRIVFE